MTIRIDESRCPLRIRVEEPFVLEDVEQIRQLITVRDADPTVLVDLGAVRSMPLVTLWMLIQVALREPGRYRIEGLTMSDLRLLHLLGVTEEGQLLH